MEKKKILLIIPAYNEEDNILSTYQSILECNKRNKTNYDVIVINDGSKDHTEDILVENHIPHISLIHNLGIGGAVQTGYQYARSNDYDIAIQFDGDGQHDVNYVSKLVEKLINDDDNMVIGSRFIDDGQAGFKSSQARRIGIKLISFFMKLVTGKKIYDTTSGFRAVDKSLIEFFSEDYPFEYPEPISTTLVLKKKYQVGEIAVSMKERMCGKSSIHTWKNVYYMINVILSVLVAGIGRKK